MTHMWAKGTKPEDKVQAEAPVRILRNQASVQIGRAPFPTPPGFFIAEEEEVFILVIQLKQALTNVLDIALVSCTLAPDRVGIDCYAHYGSVQAALNREKGGFQALLYAFPGITLLDGFPASASQAGSKTRIR